MSLARYAYAPMRALLHAVFRVLDHATTAAFDTAILTAYDYGAKKEARRDLPLGRTTSVSSAFSTYVYDPLLAHAPGTGDSVITAFTAYAYRPQYTSTQHAPATTTPHGTHAETDLHFHAYGSLDVCRWPSRDPIEDIIAGPPIKSSSHDINVFLETMKTLVNSIEDEDGYWAWRLKRELSTTKHFGVDPREYIFDFLETESALEILGDLREMHPKRLDFTPYDLYMFVRNSPITLVDILGLTYRDDDGRIRPGIRKACKDKATCWGFRCVDEGIRCRFRTMRNHSGIWVTGTCKTTGWPGFRVCRCVRD